MGADMAAEGMFEVMATVGMAIGTGTVIVAEAGMAADVGMVADGGYGWGCARVGGVVVCW